jgi:hypothetical protein
MSNPANASHGNDVRILRCARDPNFPSPGSYHADRNMAVAAVPQIAGISLLDEQIVAAAGDAPNDER